MTHKPGDFIAIPFPYSDITTTKRRPVLVVTAPDFHGDFMGIGRYIRRDKRIRTGYQCR